MLSVNRILYAEDNENDVMLVEMAFRKAAPSALLHIVPDGHEAIAYLKGDGRYADRKTFPLPNLVLLDLKMPRKTGFEVLQWVRSESVLKQIPVVMMTTSLERKDQERCYCLGANSFVVKPGALEDLIALVSVLSTYWLQWNKSPHLDDIE